ncbi:MAG: hypothetical protein RR612_01890 [Oscillospiraceae bacterium]
MNLFAFVLCTVGFLLLLRSRLPTTELQTKSVSLKRKIHTATAKPKNNFMAKAIRRTAHIVAVEKLPGGMTTVWTASTACACAGLLLCNFIDNMYLSPVLGSVLAALPFIVITLHWQEKEKQMHESLAVALRGITTSYLRGNNTIVRAIKENVPQFNGVVAQVFGQFLMRTSMVDSSTEEALSSMKETIQSAVFARWVDAVIRCQRDHNLKSTLPHIVDKFSDLRTVANETSLIMEQPRRTFFLMLGAAVFAPFFLYFLNAEWWNIITTRTSGKMLVALHVGGTAVALVIGLSAMKPIAARGEQV